jgi:hypothetical protein
VNIAGGCYQAVALPYDGQFCSSWEVCHLLNRSPITPYGAGEATPWDNRLVLATIDDNVSRQKLGRFPWSRQGYVQLLILTASLPYHAADTLFSPNPMALRVLEPTTPSTCNR